jgi:hypothetical protein
MFTAFTWLWYSLIFVWLHNPGFRGATCGRGGGGCYSVEVCPSYEWNTSSSNVTYRSEHSTHINGRNQGKYSKKFHEINLNLKVKFEGKSANKACGNCVDCSTDCLL